MASESSPAMDIVICKLIGFDENKIPLINALKNGDTTRLLGEEGKDIDVILNGQTAKLQETTFPDEWHYRPHDSWKEVL